MTKKIMNNIVHSKGNTKCIHRYTEFRSNDSKIGSPQRYLKNRCEFTKSKCTRINDSEKTCPRRK